MKLITPRDIANIYGMSERQAQRKVSSTYKKGMTQKIIKADNGRFYIDEDIVYLFKPVYKKSTINPYQEYIVGQDWDLFCDFVPTDSTPVEVLKAIMHEFFDYLKKKLKRPITLYYVIEKQPKAGMHVHFFISSEYYLPKLIDIINTRIKILSLCDQYHDYFKNEIKIQATNYLNKGKALNFKNAEFVFAELLMSGKRGGYSSIPWLRKHK